MKILLTLVFATMFYSAGFSQQVQLLSGDDSGSGASAAEQKQGFAVNKRHLVTKGETLWGLSQKYYKDPFKWGRIYNANINSVSNPDLIYPENELEIPDITEEVTPSPVRLRRRPAEAGQAGDGVNPLADYVGVAVPPAAQKEPVIGEDETMKEPELESSEILTAQDASAPATASSAGKLPAGPVAVKIEALPQPGEKPEELFKRDDLSDEMPADQKEWSSGVKIVNGNWLEDGVITSKAASDEDAADSLSFSGETVLVRLRLEGLVKKGDYLEAYLKGTSAYDKKGHRLCFELQRAGSLEVLSVDGKLIKAKVLDASTSISKGLIVKKK